MCSGRVDPQFVLQAFAKGADGVLIGGCHIGDCHYVEGNYKAVRRVRMLRRVLQGMGIEEDRFRLEWISASEGEKVKLVINDMVEKVRALGPLGLPQRFQEWDEELESLQHAVAASPEEAPVHVG
jgi:F420-non-reducing hydrogenase iron-sulfur subunit